MHAPGSGRSAPDVGSVWTTCPLTWTRVAATVGAGVAVGATVGAGVVVGRVVGAVVRGALPVPFPPPEPPAPVPVPAFPVPPVDGSVDAAGPSVGAGVDTTTATGFTPGSVRPRTGEGVATTTACAAGAPSGFPPSS